MFFLTFFHFLINDITTYESKHLKKSANHNYNSFLYRIKNAVTLKSEMIENRRNESVSQLFQMVKKRIL